MAVVASKARRCSGCCSFKGTTHDAAMAVVASKARRTTLQWLLLLERHDTAMAELERHDAAKCQTEKIPFLDGTWHQRMKF
jgi:hypothetical protein